MCDSAESGRLGREEEQKAFKASSGERNGCFLYDRPDVSTAGYEFEDTPAATKESAILIP